MLVLVEQVAQTNVSTSTHGGILSVTAPPKRTSFLARRNATGVDPQGGHLKVFRNQRRYGPAPTRRHLAAASTGQANLGSKNRVLNKCARRPRQPSNFG
jgi:hypothetical protein